MDHADAAGSLAAEIDVNQAQADETYLLVLEGYRKDLRRWAERGIGPAIRAKVDRSDVVQRTIDRAWVLRDRFRDLSPKDLLAGLRQIAKGIIVDALRALKGPKRDVRRESPLTASGHSAAQPVAPQASPSESAARRELNGLLDAAVAALPPDLREVIDLWLQGLSQAEIARRLAISPPTVGRRIRQAFAALRTLLPDCG